MLENAQTLQRPLHTVLGAFFTSTRFGFRTDCSNIDRLISEIGKPRDTNHISEVINYA